MSHPAIGEWRRYRITPSHEGSLLNIMLVVVNRQLFPTSGLNVYTFMIVKDNILYSVMGDIRMAVRRDVNGRLPYS